MVLGCTQPSADAYLAVPRSPAILFFDRGDYTRHRFTAFFFHFSFVVVYISVLGNAHECCTDAHNITTAMRNLIKSLLRTRHHQKCPSSLSALEYNNLDCCVCVFVFSFQKHNLIIIITIIIKYFFVLFFSSTRRNNIPNISIENECVCVWIVIILCEPASSCFLMIEFLCFWEFLSRLEWRFV